MAVEIDGKIIRSLPEQVSKNMEDNERQDDKLTELERKLDAAISGVLHYKGSVATYADLPADAEVGDVYNVIDTGANYAWTGSGWDEFGSTVDLSGYVQKAVNEIITGKYDFQNGFYIDSQSCEIKPDQYGFSVESYSDPGRRIAITTNGIVGNDNQDLGSSTYTWNALYAEVIIPSSNLTIGKAYNSIIVDSYFVPKTNNQYDIGNSSYLWKDLYLGGNAKFYNTNTSYVWNVYQSGSGHLQFDRGVGNVLSLAAGTLFPNTDGLFNIGQSNHRIDTIYLKKLDFSDGTYSRTIDFAAGVTTFFFQNEIRIRANNLTAYSNNQADLGTVSIKWKDLYLAGNLSDGTNSVNIADLKALIDYAKAQGWIS